MYYFKVQGQKVPGLILLINKHLKKVTNKKKFLFCPSG